MIHNHTAHKVVNNRPGLATVKCGCGKLILYPYDVTEKRYQESKEYRALLMTVKDHRILARAGRIK